MMNKSERNDKCFNNIPLRICGYLLVLFLSFLTVGWFEWASLIFIGIFTLGLVVWRVSALLCDIMVFKSNKVDRSNLILILGAFIAIGVSFAVIVFGINVGVLVRDKIFLLHLEKFEKIQERVLSKIPNGIVEFDKIRDVGASDSVFAAKDSKGVFTVVFVTGRGFLINRFGYMYTTAKRPEDFNLPSSVRIRKKLLPHWYALHSF